MRYTIFVPCYNEEKCLDRNIRKLYDYLTKTGLDFVVWIVDDCSTDNTREIANNLNLELARIGVHGWDGDKPTRRENLFKSMHLVESDIKAFIDCDLSTDLTDLENLLLNTQKGIITIGDRYAWKSVLKRSCWRYCVSKCLNWYTRLLFRTGIQDHFIGFKSFHTDDFRDLYLSMGVSTSRSMWADAELIIWANTYGIGINQIPVTWTESKFSKLNIRRESKMLLYSLWFKLGQWIN